MGWDFSAGPWLLNCTEICLIKWPLMLLAREKIAQINDEMKL